MTMGLTDQSYYSICQLLVGIFILTVWENIYECSEKYICAIEFYLLSRLYHEYNYVINSSVVAPRHGKYVADGLNYNENMFLTILMKTVKLPRASTNDSHMAMHTTMSDTYISLARVFILFSDPTRAHGFIDHRKDRK